MTTNKWLMNLVLAGTVALAGASSAAEADAAKTEQPKITPQTTCPVMGGKINTHIYADHDGKRVYFCCPMCTKAFAKEPETFIKKLEDSGVTVAKVQTTCPVTGEAVDRNLYVDHDGKRVHVCCKGCVEKVKADAATYIKKMEDAGIALDDAKADEGPAKAGHSQKTGGQHQMNMHHD